MPRKRAWLAAKYPTSWPELAPLWQHIEERWAAAGPGLDWFVHGATPIGFCHLCQLVLCGGTTRHNTAEVVEHQGKKLVFCSAPCRWIFEREPERYHRHENLVDRILAGKAPGNLLALVRHYFGTQARDLHLERTLEQELEDSSHLLDRGLVDKQTSPSSAVAQKEQMLKLVEALNLLPQDYREVIVLRQLEGLEFADVAARMGRSVDSVQKLWVRGLDRLRREMAALI